eukprot:1625775-Rhodomonas_salina.1
MPPKKASKTAAAKPPTASQLSGRKEQGEGPPFVQHGCGYIMCWSQWCSVHLDPEFFITAEC